MRVVLTVLAIVALSIGGYGLYWQSRLSPIMDSPGVRLIPERLQLQPMSSGRAVDLGFAEFELPEPLSKFLIRHDDSLFVSATEGPEMKSLLTICPPVFEEDAEVQHSGQEDVRNAFPERRLKSVGPRDP